MENKQYKFDINPFSDLILLHILDDADFSKKDKFKEIFESFVMILKNLLFNEDELVYLDFEIKENEYGVYVRGKNILCSLWLCGLIPYDGEKVLNDGVYLYDNFEYTFDKVNNELNVVEIDE